MPLIRAECAGVWPREPMRPNARLTSGVPRVSWPFSDRRLSMTTKLDRTLKRELTIGGEPYTLTLSDEGFTLSLKGRRKGLDIRWADLVGGDAALATALNASLTANIVPRHKPAVAVKEKGKPALRPDAARPKDHAARPKDHAARPNPDAPRPKANARQKTNARPPSRPRASSSRPR